MEQMVNSITVQTWDWDKLGLNDGSHHQLVDALTDLVIKSETVSFSDRYHCPPFFWPSMDSVSEIKQYNKAIYSSQQQENLWPPPGFSQGL